MPYQLIFYFNMLTVWRVYTHVVIPVMVGFHTHLRCRTVLFKHCLFFHTQDERNPCVNNPVLQHRWVWNPAMTVLQHVYIPSINIYESRILLGMATNWLVEPIGCYTSSRLFTVHESQIMRYFVFNLEKCVTLSLCIHLNIILAERPWLWIGSIYQWFSDLTCTIISLSIS